MTSKDIECTSRYCNPDDLLCSIVLLWFIFECLHQSLDWVWLCRFLRTWLCISLPGSFLEIPFHRYLASIWNPPLAGFICFRLVVGGWKARREHSLRLLMDWKSEDFHLDVLFSRQHDGFSPFICMTRYFSKNNTTTQDKSLDRSVMCVGMCIHAIMMSRGEFCWHWILATVYSPGEGFSPNKSWTSLAMDVVGSCFQYMRSLLVVG